MIQAFSNLATSFGISASAGLNAYLPLLIVAIAARFTPLLKLNEPFDLLTDNLVMAVLVALLLVETFADKIPAVDTANDVVQTIIRPTAGAILFAASNNVIADVHPVLALICGLLLAGSIHAVKASVRPAVTAFTGGLGNPVLSLVEDVVAATVTILSILLPFLMVVLLGLFLLLLFLLWRQRASPMTGSNLKGKEVH